jgi:hypothetical protein
MAKERKGAPPPGRGFRIFMACCALGAITLVALLLRVRFKGSALDRFSRLTGAAPAMTGVVVSGSASAGWSLRRQERPSLGPA